MSEYGYVGQLSQWPAANGANIVNSANNGNSADEAHSINLGGGTGGRA